MKILFSVYKEGKTWTIERYCPKQIRIGCNAGMTFDTIKTDMLHSINVEVVNVEHTITDELNRGEKATSSFGSEISAGTQIGISAQLKSSSGIDVSNTRAHSEVVKATYMTVDVSNTAEFIKTLKVKSSGQYFVLDNFHYLQPDVQQQFCSLLKEFNYHGIKVIIVGVWKDASRITSLAPDLLNRCQHIDIGSWSEEELREVVKKGEEALNISISDSIQDMFIGFCANNIGIFKDYLQKLCQKNGISRTLEKCIDLDDEMIASEVADEVVSEAYKPLHDRLINLAMPQREKKDSKHMRQKMVISILRIINEKEVGFSQSGINISVIKEEVDRLCSRLNDEAINISNLTQELGVLHQREENRQTSTNFIPLFFYDKANKKLLVLEPTIYEIRAYNSEMIDNIITELEGELKTPNKDECVPMALG